MRSSQLPNHFPKPEATGESGGMWQWGGWMLLRTGLPSKWKPQPVIWKGKVYHGKTPRTTNGLLCATDFRFLSPGLYRSHYSNSANLNLPSLLWWTQSYMGKSAFSLNSLPSWRIRIIIPNLQVKKLRFQGKSLINAINTWVINRGVECLCSRLVEVLWFHESFLSLIEIDIVVIYCICSQGEPEPATLQ